jgi:hypothetical protein
MTKSDLKEIVGAAASDDSGTMKYRSIKPLIVNAIQVSGPADVPSRGGLLHAAAGDWVVLDPHGNLRVCDDAYFRGNYARLKVARTLEQFREQTPGSGC